MKENSQQDKLVENIEVTPNIFNFPEGLRAMIIASIRNGQIDLASELIGNYLRIVGDKHDLHDTNNIPKGEN